MPTHPITSDPVLASPNRLVSEPEKPQSTSTQLPPQGAEPAGVDPTGIEQRRRAPRHGAAPSSSKSARQAGRRALPFILPFGLLFIGVYLIPIGYSLYQSMFTMNRSGLGLGDPEPKFSWFANYARAFGDPAFMGSLKRVLLIGVVQVPVMLLLSLVLALLIDARGTLGRKAFRIIYFLPYALPGVIAGLMWSFLYAPSLSPIVQLAEKFSIPLDFTSDAALPWAIGNIMTWAWTGYNMIIIYSSLQSIPAEVMEAAALDGCSPWQAAWRIKVPMVRPAILMTAVFSIIGTAQLYNEPVIMKGVAPNLPSDFTPIMSALKTLTGNYPYAATKAVILALFIGVCSAVFFAVTRRKDDA
jgi:multiple sugar transport system permease protein